MGCCHELELKNRKWHPRGSAIVSCSMPKRSDVLKHLGLHQVLLIMMVFIAYNSQRWLKKVRLCSLDASLNINFSDTQNNCKASTWTGLHSDWHFSRLQNTTQRARGQARNPHPMLKPGEDHGKRSFAVLQSYPVFLFEKCSVRLTFLLSRLTICVGSAQKPTETNEVRVRFRAFSKRKCFSREVIVKIEM